jgi:hypothetical protein
MFTGILLVFIGIYFLLRNLGIITDDFWEIFWPIIIIALGLSFLGKRGKTKWKHYDTKDETD